MSAQKQQVKEDNSKINLKKMADKLFYSDHTFDQPHDELMISVDPQAIVPPDQQLSRLFTSADISDKIHLVVQHIVS